MRSWRAAAHDAAFQRGTHRAAQWAERRGLRAGRQPRAARLGRWQGLVWRLQIAWRDRRRDRSLPLTDPWDCGWWREGALTAAAAFRPRRPTLLLVREPAPAEAAALLATFNAQQAHCARPLRLLVVSAALRVDMPEL